MDTNQEVVACRKRPDVPRSTAIAFIDRLLHTKAPPELDRDKSSHNEASVSGLLSSSWHQLRKNRGVLRHLVEQRQELIPLHQLQQLFSRLNFSKKDSKHGNRELSTLISSSSLSPFASCLTETSSINSKDDASIDEDGGVELPLSPVSSPTSNVREYTGGRHYATRPGHQQADGTRPQTSPAALHNDLKQNQSVTPQKRRSIVQVAVETQPAKQARKRRVCCLLHRGNGLCEICRGYGNVPTAFDAHSKVVGHALKSNVSCANCHERISGQAQIEQHKCGNLIPQSVDDAEHTNRWPFKLCPDKDTLVRLVGRIPHPAADRHDWEMSDELGNRWINAWCWLMEFYVRRGRIERNVFIPWPYFEELEQRRGRSSVVQWSLDEAQGSAGPQGTAYWPELPFLSSNASSVGGSEAQFSQNASSDVRGSLARHHTDSTLLTPLSSRESARPEMPASDSPVANTHQYLEPRPHQTENLPFHLDGHKASTLEEIAFMGGQLDNSGSARTSTRRPVPMDDLTPRLQNKSVASSMRTARVATSLPPHSTEAPESLEVLLDRATEEHMLLKRRLETLEQEHQSLIARHEKLQDLYRSSQAINAEIWAEVGSERNYPHSDAITNHGTMHNSPRGDVH